jgi:hypothetical protein
MTAVNLEQMPRCAHGRLPLGTKGVWPGNRDEAQELGRDADSGASGVEQVRNEERWSAAPTASAC